MEDYHSSSSLPDLTMTGLDDTDPDTEGVLGSFPSCIDQSIISIIEDSSQTENKQLLDEESEATLLTALTEILDTVDDENPSPFDSIPDSEIFALPKGGCGCSLVGRQSCAVLPDSGKELFAHWVPAASKGPSTLWRLEKPKNRSFGEGISQQRSDGEEEDEDMINNGQGVSESGSELLDLHSGEQLNTPGLESGVTLLIGQNLPCGFNMKHVSLSDLVKYVHPYCLPMEAGTDSAGSVIELDVQVVQEGEMLDLEIPTVLCQGSECLPGGTVETGTELAAGEDPGPESQLQTLEQQEVLPAPPVQQESPPVLVRRRGRPRKTVKPTKTLVIGVQQDSTETPHSQSGLQTLLQTTENKKETPNKAQPLLAHRKQEGLAVTLQESRLLAQQMEEVKLGARRIQTRGRTAAGRESRQRATVSKVARGQRKPSPSETWSAKRGWSFPWVQDGAVEPPETAVKQLTHPEQRLERISTQALCIDPDPDPVPPPRADPEPAPQADPNPAQAPRTDPTPADPTPAPRMGSDPALAPQLPACDVPSPVVPANGSNEPRLRPISLQQYRLRLQQRQQQSTLSAHANPRFGSDSGRKSAWPIVPIQSIVQGELSVLPLETAGHMVRGQAMGREGQPSAPPARNLTPPARTLIPPTLPPATLAAPVRALLPPSLAQPVRALAPPTLTPPVRALLPPTLAQPVRALAPPTMSPPVRALAPPTLAPPVGALAPPVRALAPPVRALTPPTLAPPDRALTPPTMAPPVRALTPPTLAPPVRALTPPTLAPPVRALAPPVRALTPPTLAPPVRALTPPTLAPPVRALTPPTLAPPVRALTPPTLAPPVRALTPPTLAPPVRALTPPTLAPPVRALTPPTLAPPGRALTPPTLAPPGRALTPPTLAPPGRALTPPTLAPPGRALTPPTLAPPGRALTPPTLAPPGRALTPPTLAPPGRALTPPTLAPPGRALTPPTLAPPGRALTPPTLAPPGRALAPPTLAPPGRALAPPGRALTPPTLAPPGRALTPPTLAPPGRALAPPGRALTPPTLAPPGRALTPPTLAPPVCALALPVQSLALPTLAPPAQTLALALPTRALIPLSLAPPGCGIMREQPPEFQYKSKQEVVKPATLQGGLNPPAQTRILALQPRLVQDTPALTLCMGTVLTPTTLAQLPAECPSSMPTVSVQAVAVRMCSTTRGEDILSQQNNLLQAEAVKVSTVQTVPVKSPPVQQLQSTEVALAKQEVDQGTLNSAKEASAAKDNPKGIEAADVMSLLEQFEVTEATEEPPPGNSTGSEVSEERKLLDHIFGAELASTAGLTPPATPPHQIWKSVPPVGFLGKRKSQGVESFPGSPLRTVKLIEPKPLPQNNRTKCVAIVSPQPPPETTLTALLDFGDHVYCLPRVSTQPLSHNICPPVVAQPDVGCRWNVRRQASITIKPITLLNHQCLSLTHRVLTAEEQRVSEPGRNGSTSDFQETPQEARASFNSLPTGIASVDPGRSCSQAAGTRNVGCDAALGLKGGRCATMSPCKNGETKQGKPFDSPHRCSRTLTSPCYRHHRYSSCSSSSSTSRSRSHSPAQKRRRYCRRRSRHSRHSSRSDSRSSSRSRSYSRSNSRSDSGSRSRSRSRSRSSRRCSIRMSYFTDAYDPYIEEPRNRYLRHEARARNSRRRELAIDERRVVYVGKIRTGMMREELRRRFEVFGEIEDCNIYFRNEGDNYGFVTYRYTCDAFAAIENGQTLRKPDELPFDLCFGGRRQFCKTNYADLDSSHTDFGSCSTKSKFDSLDFDTLLKQAKRSLRR